MEAPEDTRDVAAGLVVLTKGAVKSVDDIALRLRAAGAPVERVKGVIKARRPWARALRR